MDYPLYTKIKIAIQETQAPLAALCRRLQALRRQQAAPHLAAVQQLQLTGLALEPPRRCRNCYGKNGEMMA